MEEVDGEADADGEGGEDGQVAAERAGGHQMMLKLNVSFIFLHHHSSVWHRFAIFR